MFMKKQIQTMNLLCNEWYCSKKNVCKPTTLSLYRTITQTYILPYFSDYDVNSIDQKQLDNFTDYLLKEGKSKDKGGLSPNSVNSILIVLKQILSANPYLSAHSSDIPSITYLKKAKNNISVLTNEEQNQLQKYLVQENTFRGLGIIIAMYSGIRIGELCCLQWKDISRSGILDINKTILRIQNVDRDPEDSDNNTKINIGPPKTLSSNRKVPLPDFLIEYLERKRGLPDHYVLTNAEKYMEPRLLQYWFKKYLQICNLPSYNFHALRHTFATSCIEVGVDYKTLSELLGHSSVKITMDIYVHSSLKLKKSNMEKLASYKWIS